MVCLAQNKGWKVFIVRGKRREPEAATPKRTLITMTDKTAEVARLMKVTEAVVEELARQGVLEIVADYGFDPIEMAKAVIKAADGDVVPIRKTDP